MRTLVAKAVVVLSLMTWAGLASADEVPILARPDLFKIEPFTHLSLPDPLVGFALAVSDGTKGFPRGLLVSTGPQAVTDRVLFIDPNGNASVFKTGFVSNEGLAFATGAYGQGLFVGEIQQGTIVRLLPDKTTSTFSTGFTPAGSGLGPAQLTYGPGGALYATDFASGTIRRVNADGSTQIFASNLPIQTKGIVFDPTGVYGGSFVASNFTFLSQPGQGDIFSISSDGNTVTQLSSGLSGVDFLTFGDPAAFQGPQFSQITVILGDKILVSSVGLGAVGDGSVSILNTDGTLSPFITNIDASDVIFDPTNALGGGLFVTDVDRGVIWHVTAVPEPSSLLLLSLGLAVMSGLIWKRSEKLPS